MSPAHELDFNDQHDNGMRKRVVSSPDSLIPIQFMIQDTGSGTRV
jgi:hypothetical protein